MPEFTAAQVAEHKTAKDCWITVNGRVFDVTKFLGEHPGGKKVLTRVAGKDASDQFNQLHKASVLDKVAKPFEVGILKK